MEDGTGRVEVVTIPHSRSSPTEGCSTSSVWGPALRPAERRPGLGSSARVGARPSSRRLCGRGLNEKPFQTSRLHSPTPPSRLTPCPLLAASAPPALGRKATWRTLGHLQPQTPPGRHLPPHPVLLSCYSRVTPIPPSGAPPWVGSSGSVGTQVWSGEVGAGDEELGSWGNGQ